MKQIIRNGANSSVENSFVIEATRRIKRTVRQPVQNKLGEMIDAVLHPYDEKAEKMLNQWFDREYENHYANLPKYRKIVADFGNSAQEILRWRRENTSVEFLNEWLVCSTGEIVPTPAAAEKILREIAEENAMQAEKYEAEARARAGQIEIVQIADHWAVQVWDKYGDEIADDTPFWTKEEAEKYAATITN